MTPAQIAELERLRTINAELLKALAEILPYAVTAIEQLNKKMVGNLYPAINLAMLDRAQQAIEHAKKQP